MLEAFLIAIVFTALTVLLTGTAMWSSGGKGGKDRAPEERRADKP